MANYTTIALKPLNDGGDSDIFLDKNGNIALVFDEAAAIQTISTNVRMWLGEYDFDVTRGVNYPIILGQQENRLVIYKELQGAVYKVPYVTAIGNIGYNYQTNSNAVSDTKLRILTVYLYIKLNKNPFQTITFNI